MEIYNKSGYFNYSSLKSGNYKGSQIWANLSTGQYTVELYVRSKKFQWLEFRAMKTIYMFELELDHYDINPKIKYVNDEVTFDIDVYLKGDNNELNEWIKRGVQFGYYIKYSNNTPEYYPVANFSSIFEMTPLTCKLIINKNNFPEEYKNYSTYEAIAILITFNTLFGLNSEYPPVAKARVEETSSIFFKLYSRLLHSIHSSFCKL